MATVAFLGTGLLGGGMVEAGHGRQTGRVVLLRLVELVTQQVGQALGGVPGPVRATVGHHELPTHGGTVAGSGTDGHPALMDGGVMPLAQQDQIIQIGDAAISPGHTMVGLQMPGLVAAGKPAHRVADHQRPPQRPGHQPPGAAERQHLAMLSHDRTQHVAVADKPAGRLRLDWPHPVNVAGRINPPRPSKRSRRNA